MDSQTILQGLSVIDVVYNSSPDYFTSGEVRFRWCFVCGLTVWFRLPSVGQNFVFSHKPQDYHCRGIEIEYLLSEDSFAHGMGSHTVGVVGPFVFRIPY